MRYKENNDAIKKYNCATMALLQRHQQRRRYRQKHRLRQRQRRQQQQQQQLQQQQPVKNKNKNNSKRNHKKIRKKILQSAKTITNTKNKINRILKKAREAAMEAAVFFKCNYNFSSDDKNSINDRNTNNNNNNNNKTKNNIKWSNRSRNSNKLLIALLSLVITMTVMATTTTSVICPAAAMSMKSGVTATAAATATNTSSSPSLQSSSSSSSSSFSSSSLSPLASAKATGAESLFLSPTLQQQHQRQQRQKQQQQQLFAMLTKNRQTSGHYLQQQQHQEQQLPTRRRQYFGEIMERQNEEDDDSESNYNDNYHVDVNANERNEYINTSVETSGFVADDGQQYEKAEQIASIASDNADASGPSIAISSGGGFGSGVQRPGGTTSSTGVMHVGKAGIIGNCPKECKCLNDFFDCGKRHLDRVPLFPSYVQTIDLIGNKLNDTTVLQIRNLSELVKLSLKRNQLDTVPKFVGLPSLKQLNLANNRLQRISSEALAALPKLKALDLSRNILHTVESSYFPKNNRLAHLILSNNEIASISENTYENLGDLIELDLSYNRLTTLPAGVFRNLGKLKKLSLNYNQLEINWSTFKGLISLQRLQLRSNNIRSLQDGVFHVMRSIESIELDHNSITSLSRQGLFNLTKLHHLSLSNNSISYIELDTWEFTQSLITLDLSHNNITEFKPQHLECLQRLRHLNLGHNKINYLVETTFDCVKNLEDLNLRRNKLAWVIEDLGTAPPFKGLRKLKKLDLYGNNLKQINTKSLNGLSNLETLNLGGNSLASIQSGAFEHMPHLQKVNFKSLNFICDCELLWFRRWLQRTQTPQNSGNAVCGYPEHFLDREVIALTPAELVCAETPKPHITKEPTNQLAVKGANITMECIAISPAAASLAAADELKIKWRHDNQQVRERTSNFMSYHQLSPPTSTETQIHHNQETNQTTIIGYLRLYNVSYDSAGKYQCVVSNAFGTTYSQRFKLSIGIHPLFLQTPTNLNIDSGDTARLVCSATGDPMPEIALQKFGASDFPAATERRLKVVREENAFIITNAKPIDTGTYTCTAESAAGEIKVNATLIVNDKPLPVIPLIRKEIVLTQPSVLECLIGAEKSGDLTLSPPPNRRREWFKDNKPFHTSATSASERYYFTSAKELLIIVNTQDIDAGHYRCEISDDAKSYNIEMELVVRQEDDVGDVNRHIIIIVSVTVVTSICILFGSCIIWLIMFVQRKKMLPFGNISSQSGGRRFDGHQLVSASATNTLTDSHSGSLERTQLTTLNRTYLQQPQHHNQQHQLQLQQRYFPPPTALLQQPQRPRSAISDELEAEQRNRLIGEATCSRNYPVAQHYTDDNGIGIGGITLEYLSRGDEVNLLDHHHNQDHLSSKDSGTGSDAAAKRSIDDFTLSLGMTPDETAMPTPQQQRQQKQHYHNQNSSLASTPAYKKHMNIEPTDETEFLELNALGMSPDYAEEGERREEDTREICVSSPPTSFMPNGICKITSMTELAVAHEDNVDSDENNSDHDNENVKDLISVDKSHLLRRLNPEPLPSERDVPESDTDNENGGDGVSNETLNKDNKHKKNEEQQRESRNGGKLKASTAILNKSSSSTNFYNVGNRQYAAVDI